MELWTLDELVARAAELLSTAGVDQASGRVRETPDPRTVRYYGTLGLIDRPQQFRGRVGLYGKRQLWQLLAIKRLQSRGEPLQEIQRRLLGATDAELRKLAAPPAGALAERPEPAPKSERAERFWLDAPAEAEPEPHEGAAQPAPKARTLTGVELDEAVTLMLGAARRPVEDDDVEALRAAAAPLLRLLKARNLI